MIYRMGRVRRSAHLHRYRYGGSAAPVPETDRGELEPQNGEALTFSYSACSKHRCHKLKKKNNKSMPLPVNREDIDEDINLSVIIYGLSKVT